MGHMTYPSLNLILGTLMNTRNAKSRKKEKSRTAKFEVCSIEILEFGTVQISENLYENKLLEGKACPPAI